MVKKSTFGSSLSPEYALLGLLALKPGHGYEIHQRLSTDLGQIWHISLSQTYNILNRLEAKDYIQGILEEQERLPTRRQFLITGAGRQHFENWLQEPSGSSARAIRVEFTTRLYFAQARNPEFAQQLIERQKTEIEHGLLRLQEELEHLSPEQTFNRLGLTLRIHQLTSIIDWLSTVTLALKCI